MDRSEPSSRRTLASPVKGEPIVARRRRLWRTAVVFALVATLGACANDDEVADSGFAGHWTSTQWGQHYIVIEGSTMKIIYTHDDGRAVGTVDGTTFTGWWTESPSRQPPRDAGEVEFKVIRTDDQRTIDGTWRYASDGALRKDWDLVWVDADIPADIEAKFADAAFFVPHP